MSLRSEIAPAHYYGDLVRRLFLAGAILMLVSYPAVSACIPETPVFTVFAIVMVILFAGLTNPRELWVSVANMIISGTATLVFGFYAVQLYKIYTPVSLVFWVNQVLAIIFLVAFYYSVMTLRRMKPQ